jgi:hypothetical protein
MHKYIKKIAAKVLKFENELVRNNIFPIGLLCESDIFIASYPKSGATWLQYALANLIFGLDIEKATDDFINLLIPDYHASQYFIKTGFPTLVKSHALPQEKMRKVIHLVRDGRDVMASYYGMHKSRGKQITLSDMIISKKGLFPCAWNIHCEHWIENKYGADKITITYEEMKRHPYKSLSDIAKFIQIDRTSSQIEHAILKSEFDKMQMREIKMGWKSGSKMNNGLFIRSGKVGGHVSEIPSELLNVFENENKEMLIKFGYL